MTELIVENTTNQFAVGMEVYDTFGDTIGTVVQYDVKAGWFQTEQDLLFPRDRYIPFNAVDRITPTGIFLKVGKDYVRDMYDRPPLVDVDVVPAPGGEGVVATVVSGYDGRRVVVYATTISEVLLRMVDGLKVYDLDGEKIGRLHQYDAVSGWFMVEKGVFSIKDLYVPVTAVEYLDGDGVHLRVTKEVLKTAFAVRPVSYSARAIAAAESAPVRETVTVETVVPTAGGQRIVVDTTTMPLAIERLGQSPKVYDAAGKELGRVTRYDPAAGWIMVEKGVYSPKDLFIPVTPVEYLDGAGVHLRVTQDVLKDVFIVQPANVTFVATVA